MEEMEEMDPGRCRVCGSWRNPTTDNCPMSAQHADGHDVVPLMEWRSYDRAELIYIVAEHGEPWVRGDNWYCEYCSEDPREGGPCKRYLTDAYHTFFRNMAAVIACAAAAQRAGLLQKLPPPQEITRDNPGFVAFLRAHGKDPGP